MRAMKKAAKKTARGREQDRARVAGGQGCEIRYESKKTGKSAAWVKKAAGDARKKFTKSALAADHN
jgi:hypothetical protein